MTDPGERHCLLIEPVDPREQEAVEATQAALRALAPLGWEYAGARDGGVVVSRMFRSEHEFLEEIEKASRAASSCRAGLREVGCRERSTP